MKKYFDLIVFGSAALLAVLVFPFMALPGLTGELPILGRISYTVYECLDGKGGLIVALIFTCLALAYACGYLVLKFLKIHHDLIDYASCLAGLFALVAGILYFCTPAFFNGGSIGVGAVFCGIFDVLSGLALMFFGALKAFNIKLFK